MNKNTTPRPDGSSVEFFKAFWPKLRGVLMEYLVFENPCCSLNFLHKMSLYARDPIEETSACVFVLALAGDMCLREPCCRR
jgi:hypothetical protein